MIGRIRGNGSKRPVMLLAHMDVVGVERDKWSCDPFEGVVRDGYLYGRGAIDDKGMLACEPDGDAGAQARDASRGTSSSIATLFFSRRRMKKPAVNSECSGSSTIIGICLTSSS